MPKVSVVVAVYNVAQFIEQSLRCLFEQTLEDVEFVIVDDCTPDDSMEILARVAAEYPQRKSRLKIIRHDVNQGVAVTKNDGIRAAEGEYVIILDPDDYFERDMLSILYERAAESDADMAICDYYKVSSERKKRGTVVPNKPIENGLNVRDDIINRESDGFMMVRLVRRSIYQQPGFLWPVGRFAEDIVYSTITAYYSKKIVYVDQPLYYYVQHQGSLVHGFTEEKTLMIVESLMANIDIIIQFLKNEGCEDKYWLGILRQKLRARNRLLPLARSRKYRKMWFRIYPELNKILFWGDEKYHSSYKEKLWFFVMYFGLYAKLRNRLSKPKYRPWPQWSVWPVNNK